MKESEQLLTGQVALITGAGRGIGESIGPHRRERSVASQAVHLVSTHSSPKVTESRFFIDKNKELYAPTRHRVIVAEQSISGAGIDLSFHHVPDPTNWNGVLIQRCPTCRKHFRTDRPHACTRTPRRKGM